MNRQTLKQLVIESYSDGTLDAQKVNKIADLLTKKELQLYITALKNWEKANKLIIEVPSDGGLDLQALRDAFPDKKIVINTDPSLLLGMRIQNNDDIYEMSLKNSLDKITEHITEQYD